MEGGGGDLQSLIHHLHHLPRLPPWVTGGTRYGYRNPRGQTASVGYVHEVGGPPRNLPGPAQVIQCLGQVQVSVHPLGVWRGAQGHPPPPHILGEASDGVMDGVLLRRTLPR